MRHVNMIALTCANSLFNLISPSNTLALYKCGCEWLNIWQNHQK